MVVVRRRFFAVRRVGWVALLALGACHGLHGAATTQPAGSVVGLIAPAPMKSVEAIVAPPAGWRAEAPKVTSRHTHQTWVSPTGRTAYGVIHIHLPLPVGPELTLAGFLHEMRRAEGEGTLLIKAEDESLPGLRFVAEGGRYRVRVNLIVHGWTAWAIYAGTVRAEEIDPAELELAERAREATITGLPKTGN